jgi:hypothetical protein
MWTPSGYFHIGNARPELLVPGLAYQAIKDLYVPFRIVSAIIGVISIVFVFLPIRLYGFSGTKLKN